MQEAFGAPIIELPSCDSTNAFAKEWIHSQTEVKEGTVILTHNQTAGRGQGGTDWIAESGKSLTFSIILKPHFLEAHESWWLNAITSLAILYAVNDLRPPLEVKPQIKWPNDLILENKKVCGILTEAILMGSHLKYAIIGIGINVNQEHFSIPQAGSLKSVSGRDFNINQVLELVLFSVKNHYDLLRVTSRKALKAAYEDALYKRDVETNFQLKDGTEFKGKIIGIDAHGQLNIALKPGEIRSFGVKDLRMIYGA